MKWKFLSRRLRYYAQYFPFTINFFIVAAALWMCYYLLRGSADKNIDAVNSYQPLILMMGKVALWFIILLTGFSILTAIACWLFYLFLKKKGSYQLEVSFNKDTGQKGLSFETILRKARRPFLGFIKGRLIYDDMRMTGKFLMASNKKNPGRLWREAVSGKSIVILPDIKEYSISGGYVFFEDMLQLFSLPVKQQIKGHFYQEPESMMLEEKEAQPRKTDDTEIRIDQLRRVEGDYFNYKDFEIGDDVRRIVWKLYAKNRELVVRTPEIFNPFASHIYFYASFHSQLNLLQREGAFAAEMLNYYKNYIWTIYEALSKKEFEVKFIPDQELQLPEAINGTALVKRYISNCQWQKERDLSRYFEPKFGSVVCISSMNTAGEVSQLLDQCSHETVVYFIRLSGCFKAFAPWTWFLRIFLKAPEDRLRKIKSRWLLSPLRIRTLKREKEIMALLEKSNVVSGIF